MRLPLDLNILVSILSDLTYLSPIVLSVQNALTAHLVLDNVDPIAHTIHPEPLEEYGFPLKTLYEYIFEYTCIFTQSSNIRLIG